MLYADVCLADAHNYRNELFEKAFAFLRKSDLSALPLGRVEIDGDNVFANVQEYVTVDPSEKDFEAHRAYYDVQYVVSGEEIMQVAPLADLEPCSEFDESNDFGLYRGKGRYTDVVLREGQLCVVGPEDAHKPGCMIEAPAPVRKIVVKVKVAC